MIEYKYEIEKNDNYSKYNYFEISDDLKDILCDDYFLFNSKEYTKEKYTNELYDTNFTNKYDREKQVEIFQLYIDNKQFKDKVLFIYSIIDKDKYNEFVNKNSEISNPNDLYINYYIIDSDNTKVLMYNITISDISFVF